MAPQFSRACRCPGGTKLTLEACQRFGKPVTLIDPGTPIDEAARQLQGFVDEHGISVLNVAGPRASTDPSIYAFTKQVLMTVLGQNDASDGP